MNRRCFLKTAGLAAMVGAFGTDAFSGAANAGALSPSGESYTEESLKVLFNEELPNYVAALRKLMPEDKVLGFVSGAGIEYGRLMREIPYVGRLDYPLPKTLVGSAVSLSFHRVMRANGASVPDSGALVVDAFREGQKKYSEQELRAQGDEMFTGQFYQIQAFAARKSQERMFPEDWVFSFMVGTPGSGYDWGWDFTECGVSKFLKAQGAIELLPYICSLDLVLSQLQGTGLKRTTTLYDGAVCNFRYKKGRGAK